MKVASNCEVPSLRARLRSRTRLGGAKADLRNFVLAAFTTRLNQKFLRIRPLKWLVFIPIYASHKTRRTHTIPIKMKLQFLVLLLYCLTIIHAQFRIKGVVKKRDTFHRKKNINGPKCVLNETITNDYEILSSAVSESKYVFTARVLSVRKIKRGGRPSPRVFMSYKLYVRQVMKGDVEEMRTHIFSGDVRTLNGAIVFVDWLRTNKCAYRLYRHSSGIFLSDGFYQGYNSGNEPRMRLLNEPLPLSLYDLDRVNAALKGKCLQP